eukprot:GHVP01041796.1.p3 GENE.GHVP01041796.1~~GHVP01041796.1.p3  ORF type:complete len:313 (-),score=73.59 GHVP01041796.1:1049-1987(-)
MHFQSEAFVPLNFFESDPSEFFIAAHKSSRLSKELSSFPGSYYENEETRTFVRNFSFPKAKNGCCFSYQYTPNDGEKSNGWVIYLITPEIPLKESMTSVVHQLLEKNFSVLAVRIGKLKLDDQARYLWSQIQEFVPNPYGHLAYWCSANQISLISEVSTISKKEKIGNLDGKFNHLDDGSRFTSPRNCAVISDRKESIILEKYFSKKKESKLTNDSLKGDLLKKEQKKLEDDFERALNRTKKRLHSECTGHHGLQILMPSIRDDFLRTLKNFVLKANLEEKTAEQNPEDVANSSMTEEEEEEESQNFVLLND